MACHDRFFEATQLVKDLRETRQAEVLMWCFHYSALLLTISKFTAKTTSLIVLAENLSERDARTVLFSLINEVKLREESCDPDTNSRLRAARVTLTLWVEAVTRKWPNSLVFNEDGFIPLTGLCIPLPLPSPTIFNVDLFL